MKKKSRLKHKKRSQTGQGFILEISLKMSTPEQTKEQHPNKKEKKSDYDYTFSARKILITWLNRADAPPDNPKV